MPMVYSKLIAEDYAKYGGIQSKIKCNTSQIFTSRSRFFWCFFQAIFVSLGLSFGHIGVDFEYPEVFFCFTASSVYNNHIFSYRHNLTRQRYRQKYYFIFIPLSCQIVTITENQIIINTWSQEPFFQESARIQVYSKKLM